MPNTHKALVAQTVQVGDFHKQINVGDDVDLDAKVGGQRLGDHVDPAHFTPIKSATPPASAKKTTE